MRFSLQSAGVGDDDDNLSPTAITLAVHRISQTYHMHVLHSNSVLSTAMGRPGAATRIPRRPRKIANVQ